jgi:hypothetical protein
MECCITGRKQKNNIKEEVYYLFHTLQVLSGGELSELKITIRKLQHRGSICDFIHEGDIVLSADVLWFNVNI